MISKYNTIQGIKLVLDKYSCNVEACVGVLEAGGAPVDRAAGRGVGVRHRLGGVRLQSPVILRGNRDGRLS